MEWQHSSAHIARSQSDYRESNWSIRLHFYLGDALVRLPGAFRFRFHQGDIRVIFQQLFFPIALHWVIYNKYRKDLWLVSEVNQLRVSFFLRLLLRLMQQLQQQRFPQATWRHLSFRLSSFLSWLLSCLLFSWVLLLLQAQLNQQVPMLTSSISLLLHVTTIT